MAIDLFTTLYFDNTLWQYLIFFGCIIAGVLVGRISLWFNEKFVRRITSKTKFKFDDLIIRNAEKPLLVYLACAGTWIGWKFLSFPNFAFIPLYAGNILYLIAVLNTAWMLSKIIREIITVYIAPFAQKSETDLDDTLIPILNKLVGITIYALAIIIILNHFGQEIGPLLAGLGIGGLAFALAAKDLLSNIFGSITVLMDKPFKIGDRIKINDIDGFVQEINVRTTRVKTLDNTMVYIPNAKFTDSEVENVTQEPERKVMMNIGLVYDTSNMKMKKAIKILDKILTEQEGLNKKHMVNFLEFGDSALIIKVIYFIANKSRIFPIRHEVNMKIKEQFEKANLCMAYPTQTIEMRKIR